MISEAALNGRSPPVIDGFESFRANQEKVTRGSVMYVRKGYIPTSVRIREKEEQTVRSEMLSESTWIQIHKWLTDKDQGPKMRGQGE